MKDSGSDAILSILNAGLAATGQIPLWLDFLIVFLLIALYAFFSGAELAIISLNDSKIRNQADEGDPIAKSLRRLIDEPGNFLATIRVSVTFAGFFAVAYSSFRFTEVIYSALRLQGGGYKFLIVVALVVIMAYLIQVFGEMLPKRIAQAHPEKFARGVAGIIRFVSIILKPFVIMLTATTNLFLRLAGIDPNQTDKTVTEEEIRMMVDVGRESGNIHDEERVLIENVFDFNDKAVSEIMTHRTNLVSLDADADYAEVLEVAVREKYTRIPVYEDNIDNIIGILHIKDLLYHAVEGLKQPFSLRNMIREPYIVPESKTIDVLFREMQRDHAQLAVVIDEYGGTAGIVTIEDLVEEIFGSIQDEYDEEELDIVRKDENTLVISGLTPLDEVSEAVGIDFPDDEYDTIAGLVLSLLGRIPEENEYPEVTYSNLKIKVLGMDEKRVSLVELVVQPEETEEEGNSSFDEEK
ncbi:MAG: hemolysin family protein [Eubacteriales bacterium]|nr:hemolysin family protein [Eubacteriales bacterium]MDD4682182.1 hemolysin family protein [Eubacteriales bacterium]